MMFPVYRKSALRDMDEYGHKWTLSDKSEKALTEHLEITRRSVPRDMDKQKRYIIQVLIKDNPAWAFDVDIDAELPPFLSALNIKTVKLKEQTAAAYVDAYRAYKAQTRVDYADKPEPKPQLAALPINQNADILYHTDGKVFTYDECEEIVALAKHLEGFTDFAAKAKNTMDYHIRRGSESVKRSKKQPVAGELLEDSRGFNYIEHDGNVRTYFRG
jgi:hypothetical protein